MSINTLYSLLIRSHKINMDGWDYDIVTVNEEICIIKDDEGDEVSLTLKSMTQRKIRFYELKEIEQNGE